MKEIKLNRNNRYLLICSIIYAIFIIIGERYKKLNSWKIIKTNIPFAILKTIAISVIIYAILLLVKKIYKKIRDSNKKEKNFKKLKINNFFNKHPFIFSMILILISWAVYMIAFYPTIMTIDGYNQLKAFFNIKNYYSDTVILLSENVLLTNHHPVLHTLLMAGLLKLGRLFGNDNLGLFFYSIVQIVILSSALSYTIKYLKENKVRNRFLYILLLIYMLVPIYGFYAMTATKDTIYTALIIFFIIEIHKFITKNKDKKLKTMQIIRLIILMIFICLMRNNGIYVVLLTLLVMLPYSKINIKKVLISTITIILLYTTYINILLPHFKITNGSIREALSIPFQQTARYIKYYEKDVTEEERETINRVLAYDKLKKEYKPENADPIKSKYKKQATKEELKQYFRVWYKQFLKHPDVYVEAFISNTYGYIYPQKTEYYIHYEDLNNPILKIIANFGYMNYRENFINYSYNNHLGKIRANLVKYAKKFQEIPIIELLVNVGFNTWILIFMIIYSVCKKKYKNILVLMPSIVTFLVCLASPINNYLRYALPIIFSNPMLILLLTKKEE